ncbi:hypothetical protein Lalb_Chr01g0023441 [Lupinus albus]|uniref:CASP-like protein n=1 Tax=Lupinus albus TaxID=3870 RepID=A0A6A4R5T6_LUPAL|nr:hypothetical protein Lalb_Chr01g0023441 [Lupinus albus]
MSNLDDSNSSPKIHVETPPTAYASVSQNVDQQTPATGGTGGGVTGILQRWKRDDLLKKGSLGLRGAALVFSLISFIAMATNKHGDWREFDHYEEYRYLVAIAILSILYTAVQVFRQVQEFYKGKLLIKPRMGAIIDFVGDQVWHLFSLITIILYFSF